MYSLDSVHCFSIAYLSWLACLKYTKVEIQLLSDPKMYNMVERMIKGGISNVVTKYWRANNSRLPDFDRNQACSYIESLDCNGLYAHSMCQPLPVKNYKWIKET